MVYIVKAYKITASIEKNPESTNLPAYIFSYPAICSSLIVCCFTNRAGDMVLFFWDLFHFFISEYARFALSLVKL